MNLLRASFQGSSNFACSTCALTVAGSMYLATILSYIGVPSLVHNRYSAVFKSRIPSAALSLSESCLNFLNFLESAALFTFATMPLSPSMLPLTS